MGTETDTKEQDQLDKIKATIIMIMNGHIPANRRPLLLRLLIAVIAFVSLMIMAKSTSPGDSSFRGSTTISAMTMKMKPIPRTNAYRCPSDGPEVNYNGKMMSQRGEDKQLLHTFGFDQVCGGSYIESKLLYTFGLLVCCVALLLCVPDVPICRTFEMWNSWYRPLCCFAVILLLPLLRDADDGTYKHAKHTTYTYNLKLVAPQWVVSTGRDLAIRTCSDLRYSGGVY